MPASVWVVSCGGAEGDRTPDLLNAIQALSQLSYGPTETDYSNPNANGQGITGDTKLAEPWHAYRR